VPRNREVGISRRDFLGSATLWIAALLGAALASPSLVFLLSPALGKTEDSAWIDLGPLDEYPLDAPSFREFTRTSINGWERSAQSYGVFVIRQDTTKARVLSNVCTHLGCRVSWHPDLGHYVSPCHDGHFDILGMNVGGPPPRPLDEFRTRIEEGRVYIELPAFKRRS